MTPPMGMASRGVTRPMAKQQHESSEGSDEHAEHDTEEKLSQHHKHTLWVYWTVVIFGFWLLVSPFSLGYLNESLWCQPSGGRGAWWSDQTHTPLRAALMTVSDVSSGIVLLLFGWRALKPNRPVSLWICCFVGVWLVLAPVLFWAPTAAAFHNGSLVGMLLIALTILIPGMPNMIAYMQHGPGTPPGWTYNPSSWAQRWILIATGFAGFIVSRHLAMFQLGYINHVSDPFFGDSTELVLNSAMSHSWPISDAGLGTVSYTFEFLMGFMGSPKRWRTMPWMVAFFGILVIPLGLVHILLVISQPIVVGHWCTLCLLAAGIMLPMIPLEVDEVVAMGQHMVSAKRRGDRNGSLWSIFWKGGSSEGCTEDERSPALMALPDQPRQVWPAMFWGLSVPWTLVVTTAIGVWFMFQPAALGHAGAGAAVIFELGQSPVRNADVFHLAGSLIVVTSAIAMGEVIRSVRFVNLLLALIVATLPWLADGQVLDAVIGTALGLLVALLSLRRGPVHEQYDGWQRYII